MSRRCLLLLTLLLLLAWPVLGCGSDQSAEAPSPTVGSKAAAPGVPTSEHGDNSIQTWGVEASDAEREEVTRVVRAYLDARAARRWVAVCSHLAARPRAEQSRYGGGVPCPRAIESFNSQVPDGTLAAEARIGVLSLRVGGKYAFLIYRRTDGVWATALTPEGGEWKVISVTPNPIQ
jgi:hypothetical protein